MPTARELAREFGLKIGDKVMFPSGDGIHIATVMGPRDFPDGHVVYTAPPGQKDRALTVIYNCETGKTRDAFGFSGKQRIELSPGPDEVLVEQTHAGYSLFQRVNGQSKAVEEV